MTRISIDNASVSLASTNQEIRALENPITRYSTQPGVNVVSVNLQDPRVRIRNAFPYNDTGGYQSLPAIANRPGVVVAINTGYFPRTCYSSASCERICPINRSGALGICSDGIYYLDGRNVTNANWSVEGHRSWLGINRNSDHSKIGLAIASIGDHNYNVVSGGPIIVENGQPKWPSSWPPSSYGCRPDGSDDPNNSPRGVEINGELFGCSALRWNTATKMTAVGVNSDGTKMWLVVTAIALPPQEMINLLISQGAWTAIRYDSGGSSQMWYQGQSIAGGDGRWLPAAMLVSLDDNQPSPARCPSPALNEPQSGYISSNHTITFRWNNISCQHTGFNFRVKTTSDMESGGETIFDISESSTQRTITFDSRWDGRDLYWSVRAANAPGGATWASSRLFRISPNLPPSITFNTANGNGDNTIYSNIRNWTFVGTASDSENQLNRIEFRCDSCDGSGNGQSQTNGTNWSLTRTDMAGRNDVYFVVYDNAGNSTASRHLDLQIDLAPPASTVSLNNDSSSANWPIWFTNAVAVRVQAEDGSTGHARSGVAQVRYRLDGGAWQTVSGSEATFTVSANGSHSVEYYAVDAVGNPEGSRTVNFKIDQTPPSPPSGASETHGVVSNQWQKLENTPTFTWAASTDANSGVAGYQFYFDTDPNGVTVQKIFSTSDPRQWTPLPGGVRTGTYYLRGRAQDNAGNWSAWTTLFTFRYDGTPPENPSNVTHTAGITSTVWQKNVRTPNFIWPVPHDEGSGVKGYNIFWGTSLTGTSSSLITANSFTSATPLCAANAACTGYLRLRSVDNVDNVANEWKTAFVLRYDGASPIADFSINGGVTQTTQTLVTLNITASDEGSGLYAMRLSHDGQIWTPWEVYATERLWEIPDISRQAWPVYLQVQDSVGLVSTVISRTTYLDVNPQQPYSNNFRLFDRSLDAGSGPHTSPAFQGRGTVGQVLDSAQITSTNYIISGGYEAGSQAIPIIVPGYETFTFINSIFATGAGGTVSASANYKMIGTLGEVGLPNNETTLNSTAFQHQPGFLAALPSLATAMPTPVPGPTPIPEPALTCEIPYVSVNSGASFTASTDVLLSLCAPRAVEMMLSNTENFSGAGWEPYVLSKSWTLTVAGQFVQPRFVYARFKDANGTIYGTYIDDVIYDPIVPIGSLALTNALPSGASLATINSRIPHLQPLGAMLLPQPLPLLSAQAGETVQVFVNAQDDNSGLSQMQLSNNAVFSDTAWEAFSAVKAWTPEGEDGIKTVYARLQDSAGNVSTPVTMTFVLDTLPPFGGIAFGQRVAGPDTITTTVYFGAEDNLSGVSDMRVSLSPLFTNAYWRVYTTTLTWPISLTTQTEGTLYVQYRDLAGNISDVYSDTYLVDTTPPVLYVEAELATAEDLTRTVTILAYDELADLATMRLSNDPLMVDGVVTLAYSSTVEWVFDDRRVIWVQLQDSVGNWSEPYPAYAADSGFQIYLPIIGR